MVVIMLLFVLAVVVAYLGGFWLGTVRARCIIRQEYAFHCQFVVSRAVGLYSTIVEHRLFWRRIDAEAEWKGHQERVEKRMQSLGITE